MTDVHVDTTAELTAMYQALDADLHRAAEFAELGERFGLLPESQALPPPTPAMKYGRPGARSEEVRATFGGTCGRFALLAIVTAVEAHFGNLLLLLRLGQAFAAEGPTSAARAEEVRENVSAECRKNNAHGLLELLVGKPVPSDLATFDANLVTLIRARNCLAHRAGSVRAEDLRGSESALIVQWEHRYLEAKGQPLHGAEPVTLVGGDEIKLRIESIRKEFPLGMSVLVAPHECQQIAVYMSLFCHGVCEKVHAAMVAIVNKD